MSVEKILAELVAFDSTSSRPNVEFVKHLAGRAESPKPSARAARCRTISTFERREVESNATSPASISSTLIP